MKRIILAFCCTLLSVACGSTHQTAIGNPNSVAASDWPDTGTINCEFQIDPNKLHGWYEVGIHDGQRVVLANFQDYSQDPNTFQADYTWDVTQANLDPEHAELVEHAHLHLYENNQRSVSFDVDIETMTLDIGVYDFSANPNFVGSWTIPCTYGK